MSDSNYPESGFLPSQRALQATGRLMPSEGASAILKYFPRVELHGIRYSGNSSSN
jgi:hypothetical protein